MEGYISSKLPNTLFSVSVPIIATYSPEELDVYGLPMSIVNNSRLENNYETMTTVMLPLTKIIDIYNMGFPIKLNNYKDVTTIYSILENYLDDTERFKYNTIHKPKFREDRLQDIDRFASEIFNLNKITIAKDAFSLQNGFDIGLGRMMQMNEAIVPIEKEQVSRYGNRYKNYSNPNKPFAYDNGQAFSEYNNVGETYTGYNPSNAPVVNFDNVKRKSRYRNND